MMPELSTIIEQSAAAAMIAEPGDIPSFAQLHSNLTSVRDAAAALVSGGLTSSPPSAGTIQATAAKAMDLVEKIVLAEVNDTAGALELVRQMVIEMQHDISGVLSTKKSEAPAPEIHRDSPAPQSAPHAIPAEQVIKPDDVGMVHDFVLEARQHMDSAEASLLALEEDPTSADHINGIFRAFHTIKGVAGFLDLRQIGALAHGAENLLDRARKGLTPLDAPAVDLVLQSVDLMRHLIGGADAAAAGGGAPALQEGLTGMLERLAWIISDRRGTAQVAPVLPVAHGANAPIDPVPSAAVEAVAAAAAPVKAAAAEPGPADVFVKISTERLDSLIDTVGELVIAQAMVSQDVSSAVQATASEPGRGSQRLTRNMSHLGKITRSLQDLSMSMRMVPIQAVFQKMARLARDVARKNGKEIDFVQIGGETELDRNVVEAVSDPLVHMVRNAIDHGVETPEQRTQAGKPPTGRVQLKAYHQAGNVVIEVTDDGRGLNKTKILAKALTCGIIKEGQLLSDDETFRLIFHAGLSTAETITDISGRGVGMDVARKNVEALRGRIDIASEDGKGSLFTIRLPLTLAVIDGLVVRVGQQRYIIPIKSIDQSLRPTADQLTTVQGSGEMCVIRERLLPLVRLNKLFSIAGAASDPTAAILVIVQADHGACCLMVDELLGQQQVVIKSLGDRFGQAPGISGGAILGDGNVSLIVDVPGLITLAKQDS